MKAKLSFFGAAQNVTGSNTLLEIGNLRLMIDCGYYQERQYRHRNWEAFPVSPNQVDAVILTHAHLDHCGRLPRLVAQGFKGPIFCTAAASSIATIVLMDSARIQVEDVEYKKKRHRKEGRKSPHPLVPLYDMDDVEKTYPLLRPVQYTAPIEIGDDIFITFHDAGHILGSAIVEIRYPSDDGERTILFSGDIGRCDTPILRDPTVFDQADYVVMESTYGNRTHEDNSGINDRLANVVNSTRRAGGNIVIPSFAIERSQELLYRLNELLLAGTIKKIPVFLDSPMAIRVTEVFKKHPELFDEEALALVRSGRHPCDFPGLVLSQTRDDSIAINDFDEPCIIIAGSGMCTGGRIKHHLIRNIGRPESTILFVGYQAIGTLGRIILEGKNPVRIHGRHHEVHARIDRINGFSAHADRNELNQWISHLAAAPRRVFVTHGEPEAAEAMAELIRDDHNWPVAVPSYQDTVLLD